MSAMPARGPFGVQFGRSGRGPGRGRALGHAEHNNVVVIDQRDRDGRVSGRWGHTTDGKPPLGYAAAFPSLSFLAMKIIFGVCAGGKWFSGGSVVLPNWGSAGRRVLVDVEEVGES